MKVIQPTKDDKNSEQNQTVEKTQLKLKNFPFFLDVLNKQAEEITIIKHSAMGPTEYKPIQQLKKATFTTDENGKITMKGEK